MKFGPLFLDDNIKVPRSYLAERNLTSIYTKNGSEGIASLSVYHSLHCLVGRTLGGSRLGLPGHIFNINDIVEKSQADGIQRTLPPGKN